MENLALDSDFTDETYRTAGDAPVNILAPTGAAITSLNGLSGPVVTLSGGTTGYSFSTAGTTLTLTGAATSIKESSGPTTLAIGAVADGQFLKRSGSGVVGDTPTSLPVADTTAVVKGSADATKLLRFEVDGFTAGTTRVATPPNADFTMARIDAAQTFTGVQTFSGNILASSDGGINIGALGANRPYLYAQGISSGSATVSAGEIRWGATTGMCRVSSGLLQFGSGVSLGWSSGDPTAAAEDVRIKRAKAQVLEVNNAFTGGGTLRFVPSRPAQITADQNNYAVSPPSKYVHLTSDASRNVTGLSLSQVDGEEHVIVNAGSNNIVLVNESASSTAANRFTNSTGADITLSANQTAELHYDSTASRWRVFKRN